MNQTPFEEVRSARTTMRESVDWFKRQISKLRGVTPEKLLRDESRITSRIRKQKMYMFKYMPKTRKKLPYYDTFPLILPLELYPNGFLGLNFHYLNPNVRKRLLEAVGNGRVTYRSLKNNRYLKPTIKRYLNQFVYSRFLEISEEDWETSIYLPVERFEKATNKVVWSNALS